MARRRRKHIPLIELLASALADKLDPWELKCARDGRYSASTIVRQFTPDHIELHAWGGADKWWNLSMTRRGPELKAKDAADTSRAAKAVRLDDKWNGFMRAVASGRKPPPRKSRWKSRPFSKG